MSNKVRDVIDSLDTRHEAAKDILHALASGKKVAPKDIDALDSKFAQVAPLLHKLNSGGNVTQADIDALDSFAGQRLRTVLTELSAKSKGQSKAAKKRPARKK